MTETGRNFCRLKNPVLDEDLSKAFSPEESEFIMKKIIPQRELENIFVESALVRIRESKERLDADSLDIMFLEECKRFAGKNTPFSEQFKKIVLDHSDPRRDPKKQTRLMAIRVATMGRLAEIGEVKWTIGEKGKSYFTAAVPQTESGRPTVNA